MDSKPVMLLDPLLQLSACTGPRRSSRRAGQRGRVTRLQPGYPRVEVETATGRAAAAHVDAVRQVAVQAVCAGSILTAWWHPSDRIPTVTTDLCLDTACSGARPVLGPTSPTTGSRICFTRAAP
ncbi:hypothetical protein QAD02_024218 [Eretmocerus hayati]|uniref:Uncharacterized protein n=1 Tax=Eretmocerus hayati TaxID=131215 RepID=A0ACC2PZM6_9HYME|nr:hypothetical protein QAD02_024218 [Eretmocerus hayati]